MSPSGSSACGGRARALAPGSTPQTSDRSRRGGGSVRLSTSAQTPPGSLTAPARWRSPPHERGGRMRDTTGISGTREVSKSDPCTPKRRTGACSPRAPEWRCAPTWHSRRRAISGLFRPKTYYFKVIRNSFSTCTCSETAYTTDTRASLRSRGGRRGPHGVPRSRARVSRRDPAGTRVDARPRRHRVVR